MKKKNKVIKLDKNQTIKLKRLIDNSKKEGFNLKVINCPYCEFKVYVKDSLLEALRTRQKHIKEYH